MALLTLQPAIPFLLLLLLPAASAGLPGGRTLVFILAGQSNMSGRGGATNGTWDGIVPPECAPSDRIVRLSPALRWEEAREPLHAGVDVGNVLGVGPGMPFAHAVLASEGAAAEPPVVVGLVPCAQGGTPIANWSRGTELYERMVTRARAAVAECSGRGHLAALLWYQGEADTMRRQDAELYQRRMETLVRDVRCDLGRPDLLVIQYNGKFLGVVREAQKAVKLPNVKYVDAMGLPIASDHTHLTTEAQVQLGNKLAESYLETL
uniref:Sialate O-acetylesterase domain-containing protein n=1 Tax=Zea mays TaxID=4577 RepID=A0A804Q704_MAIZE